MKFKAGDLVSIATTIVPDETVHMLILSVDKDYYYYKFYNNPDSRKETCTHGFLDNHARKLSIINTKLGKVLYT